VFGVGDYVPDVTYRLTQTDEQPFAEGRPLAVDGGRVAVRTRTGRLQLLDGDAGVLATFGTVSENVRVALQGSRLVVQKGTAILVYDMISGKLVAKWPLARGP
jgi:hypothetical protein